MGGKAAGGGGVRDWLRVSFAAMPHTPGHPAPLPEDRERLCVSFSNFPVTQCPKTESKEMGVPFLAFCFSLCSCAKNVMCVFKPCERDSAKGFSAPAFSFVP